MLIQLESSQEPSEKGIALVVSSIRVSSAGGEAGKVSAIKQQADRLHYAKWAQTKLNLAQMIRLL